jgi:rhodanese-related sulfurtransferase
MNVRGVVSRRVLLTAGGATAAMGLAAWRPWGPPPGAIDAAEAHRRARTGRILLVDIRRPEEWRATGVAAGATPLDMRRRDFVAALAAVRSGAPNRPVALICAHGVRSRRLAARLVRTGVAGVLDVPEGMLGSAAGPGWIARGLPTVPGPGTR